MLKFNTWLGLVWYCEVECIIFQVVTPSGEGFATGEEVLELRKLDVHAFVLALVVLKSASLYYLYFQFLLPVLQCCSSKMSKLLIYGCGANG
mmetsp:Transcript_16883/g.20064  ORF Transcript_16883/g.20064 Transcript_16883/m.20064 type:complete len:92 (+) Transcript_16883:1256-1531(+)